MSKYRLEELINIDNRFQKSVNLLLDLQNEEKVKSYIPTRSSVNILKQYLKSIINNAGNKANILIGPYGKGKSHLLLVLMSIIAKKNKAAIDCITSKIKEVDDEAYNIIENYIKNEKPMLPVIISTAGEDLNKAFLFALNEALEDSGLSAISPKSYYSEAYKTIMVWKGNYPDTYRMFEEKVCRRGIKLSEFIKRLNSFDDRILNIFREIYPSLTAGSEFNPLISSDMLKIYKETNAVLCEKYGYSGIYIIFDEFSKFIEGHRKATFASDMNIIQNICELANNSKTEKVRITFVAHKSIKEYGNKLDKDIVDSFKGVEGRLSEVLFVVSSQNSYELIKDAIDKKKGKEIEKILAKNSFDNNMDRSYAIPCFSEIFERQDFMEVVAKGCFPLTPIASYLLLNISEKVAQNERTVFTFLSSNEPNTLCRRIAMCDEDGELFVGADAIFDYFKILFKEEITAVHIHNEWLKADYALSKTNDEVERKIIKALALIRMNARDDELSASIENIALSIGISREQCEDAIKRLEENQVIAYRAKVRSYTFRNNVGVNLEKEINEMVTKIKLSSISDAIKEISELDYILPKQYNQQYSMTRYYKYEYMMFDEFMAVKDSRILFEDNFADGKIVALINTQKPEYERIIEKSKELKDKRLIVICPEKVFDLTEQLLKRMAVKKLIEDKSFIDNNKVLVQELMLYEEDLVYEINERIMLDYKLYTNEQKVIYMGEVQTECNSFKELNRFISKICNNYYNYAPTVIDAVETDEYIKVVSGKASLIINKNDWKMEYYNEDKLLTKSSWRDLAYMHTDWKGDAYVKSSDKTYMRQQLSLSVGELIYGLGERFGAFTKNGQSIDIWNEDGGTSTEQSYKNIPFYISNKGYGIFVNHTDKVSFEIGTEAVTKAEFSVPGEKIDYFFFNGPSLKDVLRRYTLLTGRPALPPEWTFGLWLSTSFTTNYDEETVMSFIDGMLSRDIPLKVFHFDCFWMKDFHWSDFIWDKRVFPDPEGMLRRIKDKGLKICVWINPYIAQESALFDEGMEKGYFLKRKDGSVWQWDMWQPGMAIVDFTNPQAKQWFKDKLSKLVDMGVDCFKTDFGERIPVDCVYHNEMSPEKMHNYYTYLYNQTVFELLEEKKGKGEAVLFARSATVGGQKFPVHWGGDCWSDYESMEESLRGGLSLQMSGFGFWSHDIGGFENTSTADVYKRWCAFGLFSSHSRLHGSTSYRVPWAYDDEAVSVLSKFTKLKMSLMPYIWTMAVTAHTQGIPSMRAMVLEYTKDKMCNYTDKQYMFGDNLLVAPIFNEDGLGECYLPEEKGEWTDFFTKERIEGGKWYNRHYGYDEIPVFVRPNSIIPIGDTDNRPDYDYTDGITYELYDIRDYADCVIYDEIGKEAAKITANIKDNVLTLNISGTKNVNVRLINTVIENVVGTDYETDGLDTVIKGCTGLLTVKLK